MNALHSLPVNVVIKSVSQEGGLIQPHRLLHSDKDADWALLFCMEKPYKRPRRFVLHKLVADLCAGDIVQVDFPLPSVMLLPDEKLRLCYKEFRDRWWKQFEPLLGEVNLSDLFEDFSTAIFEFTEMSGMCRTTVYVGAYRFFYYGCMRNAFLPRFDRRGGPGKARILGVSKVGRVPDAVRLGHDEERTGVNVTDEDKIQFRAALDDWASGEHNTLRAAYKDACKNSFTDKRDGEPKLLKDHPTYRQFIYHAKKQPDFGQLLRRHIGTKKFDREFRAVTGKSSAEVTGPTQRYQIDATIADIYLTSMHRRDWIIGRPVIYVVADVFSGKVVGLYIGLEGPSWEGARLALLNAFLPKDEYLKRYGLEQEVTWDAHHIPGSVMADRAELLGDSARGLPMGLGVAIDIASAWRPDWKGIVERKFGVLNDIIHFLPGAVRKRHRERGDRNYALDGIYNLYEFTQIVIREFIRFNAHHKYADRLTPGMIRLGIKATPDALWSYGLEHLIGGTPYRTENEIYAHLLPLESATVREDGICFKGLLYTSAVAVQNRWFERARYHKRFVVPIRYNKEVPERIWVLSNVDSEIRLQIHEATLLDPYQRYSNLQMEEIEDVRAYEKLTRGDDAHDDLEAEIKNDLLNDELTRKAKQASNASVTSISDAKKAKNIKTKRGAEKQSAREEQGRYELDKFGNGQKKHEGANSDSPSSNPKVTPIDALILAALSGDEEAQ